MISRQWSRAVAASLIAIAVATIALRLGLARWAAIAMAALIGYGTLRLTRAR
jgi:hypothetical protein